MACGTTGLAIVGMSWDIGLFRASGRTGLTVSDRGCDYKNDFRAQLDDLMTKTSSGRERQELAAMVDSSVSTGCHSSLLASTG